jgi:hypothetical protein
MLDRVFNTASAGHVDMESSALGAGSGLFEVSHFCHCILQELSGGLLSFPAKWLRRGLPFAF